MSSIYTVTLNPGIDRELTVPDILFDQVLRSSSAIVDIGGKGFNVSRMLRSLGTPSTALGFVGGKSGEFLAEGLESLDIEPDFVWVQGESRTNVSVLSKHSSQHIKINEPGPKITEEEQNTLLERIMNRCHPGDWWVIAGSLPPGIPNDYYAKLITVIQSNHGKAILDSSGQTLQQGCSACPYLVKPNQSELQELTGQPVETENQILIAALKVQEMGPEIVVVSLGKNGALLVTDEEQWMTNSPAIIERNPIGAGDSLTAGLVWSFSRGLSMDESLRWGAACGAATASQEGTAMGSLELAKELFFQTRAKRLTK